MKTFILLKQGGRRCMAVMLSALILTASIVISAHINIPARALDGGEFVYMNGSNCYNITVHTGRNDAVKGMGLWGEELADGKGMKYTSAVNAGGNWTNYTASAYDKTVNLDGLELTFSDFKAGIDGNPQPAHKERFIIYIGSGKQSEADNPQLSDQYNSGAASLIFDGETGTVIACAGTAANEKTVEVIKNASALRLSSLKNKEFTVRFNKTKYDDFKLTVTVGERKLTGIIPSAVLDASVGTYKITDTGNVYVGLTNGKNGWTANNSDFDAYSITFVGMRESVADEDTPGDEPDDAVYMKKSNYYYQSVVTVDEYWQHKHYGYFINGICCEELSSGGVKYQFATLSGSAEGVPDNWGLYKQGAYSERVNLNGLELKFSDFTAADPTGDPSAAQKRMTLLINSGHIGGHVLVDQLNGAVALVLDAESGTVTAYAGGHTAIANGKREEAVVIENAEALKLDNLSGRKFTIGFVEERHDFKVAVTVGDTTVTGFIPNRIFALSAKYPSGIKTTDEVYIGLTNRRENNAAQGAGAALNYDAYSVNFISLRENVDLPPVIENDGYIKTDDLYYKSADHLTAKNLIGGGVNFSFARSGSTRNGYKNKVDLGNGVILHFDYLQADASDTNRYFDVLFSSEVVGNIGDRIHHGAIALRFDYVEGTVTALVGGGQINGDPEKETVPEKAEQVIAANTALQLESLKGRPFKVSVRQSSDTEFEVAVAVDGGEPIKGYFSQDLLEYTKVYDWSIKDISAVLVSLRNGENQPYQEYSIDFNKVEAAVSMSDAVMNLIDNIGTVTLDSETVINAAQSAYETLPTERKKLVTNIDALYDAQNFLAYLKQNEKTLVNDAINAIKAIGKVDRFSGDAVKEAERQYSHLSSAQKALVTNAAELDKAVAEYYKIVYYFMKSDVDLYSVAYEPNVRFKPNFWWNWPDNLAWRIGENGGALLKWTDAIRDIRSGPGGKDVPFIETKNAYRLDGLIFQFTGLTADENLTEETGVRLSIQIGNERNGYQDGKNLSLVLDTVEGGVRAYPGGKWLFKDEILKHTNGKAEDKIYTFEINKTDEGLYRLGLTVSGKRMSGIIPSSALSSIVLENPKEPNGLYVELSPWVDNEAGITDKSKHTFSAEFLSVQDTGRFAFEQANDIIKQIEALPDKATTENADEILKTYKLYTDIPRTLKALISNYAKMDNLLSQMNEISLNDDLDWFSEADIGDADINGSPKTGDRQMLELFILVGAIAAAVLVVCIMKRKNARGGREND